MVLVDEKRVREAVANRKKYRDVNSRYNLWIAGTAAVVLGACAVVLFGEDTGPLEVLVNDPSLITHVNRNAGWQAGEVAFFKGWTMGDVQRLGGVKVSNQAGGFTECTLPDVTLPRHFDARERWPGCFSRVYEQGNCSASWAIAAAGSMTNRLCISNPGTFAQLELSAQQLLSCEREFGNGCAGGMLDMVWSYMKQDGLVSSTCFPYKANGTTPCSLCKEEEPKKLASICRLSTANSIRREILLNGPVVAPVTLMNDFLVYRSGIYRETHTATQLVDLERQRQLHAVKVIGWGVEEASGKEFWIIENSFGKDWGENGYAKIELSASRPGVLLSEFAFAGTPVNPKVLKLQSEP